MEKIEEEYSIALGKLIIVKEEVAAGDLPLDDLIKAMAEVRRLKEKRKMLQDADRLVNEGAELDIEEDPEEESEEGFSFDAIDAELEDITERLKGHEDLKREHAYIIAYKRGEGAEFTINGDGNSLFGMFCSLRDHRPFSILKPVNEAEVHKAFLDLVKAFKDK